MISYTSTSTSTSTSKSKQEKAHIETLSRRRNKDIKKSTKPKIIVLNKIRILPIGRNS